MTCVSQWISESFRGLTLPVKQIEMDGLVVAEGAEGHHVLMRVESYSSKSRCVAQLRVHSDLVTCTTDIPVQSPLLISICLCIHTKVTLSRISKPVSEFHTYASPSSLPEKMKLPQGVYVLLIRSL